MKRKFVIFWRDWKVCGTMKAVHAHAWEYKSESLNVSLFAGKIKKLLERMYMTFCMTNMLGLYYMFITKKKTKVCMLTNVSITIIRPSSSLLGRETKLYLRKKDKI